MRATRSSRGAVAITPPTCTISEDDVCAHLWQDILSDFLLGAAKHITEQSVVVLQTNDWKGLSQVTEQTPMDYAYMLLRCGIVSVHRTKDMHNKIEVHQNVLKEMLQRH